MVNRATQAKTDRGILTVPARKQRQGITEEAKLQVVSLYKDSEYSRMLPGAKDKVSIRRRHYHQKRFLLCTAKKSCMLRLSLNILALKLDFLDFFRLNQNGVLHLVPLEHTECVFVASAKMVCCWLMNVICCAER